MGLWDKLSRVGSYVRKRQRSLGPEGYSQFKRGREYERKPADREREQAKDSVEHEREVAERERKYEERYMGERERDIERERTD